MLLRNINTSDGMSKKNAVIVEVLSSDLGFNNAQQVMRKVKQKYFGEPMLTNDLEKFQQTIWTLKNRGHRHRSANKLSPEVPINNWNN